MRTIVDYSSAKTVQGAGAGAATWLATRWLVECRSIRQVASEPKRERERLMPAGQGGHFRF
jgi:hypothetical protein